MPVVVRPELDGRVWSVVTGRWVTGADRVGAKVTVTTTRRFWALAAVVSVSATAGRDSPQPPGGDGGRVDAVGGEPAGRPPPPAARTGPGCGRRRRRCRRDPRRGPAGAGPDLGDAPGRGRPTAAGPRSAESVAKSRSAGTTRVARPSLPAATAGRVSGPPGTVTATGASAPSGRRSGSAGRRRGRATTTHAGERGRPADEPTAAVSGRAFIGPARQGRRRRPGPRRPAGCRR